MASQSTTNTTSRLMQMQMRFQQKQLQVREQRKLELTASKAAVAENDSLHPNKTTNLNSSIGNGKVRQMFNERRRGAGIDRSNLLKPLASRSSSTSSTVTISSISSHKTNTRMSDRGISNKHLALNTLNGNDSLDNISNENAPQTYRVDENEVDHPPTNMNDLKISDQPLENCEEELSEKFESVTLATSFEEDSNNNQEPEIKKKTEPSIKLNPVLTKKSPPITVTKQPSRASRSSLSSIAKNHSTLPSTQKQAPVTNKNSGVKNSSKMNKALASPKIISLRVPRAKTPPSQPPGTAPCKLCNRFFNEDRLTKHEEICEKMAMKKRKIFDASKHRVKGTEAEKYLKKSNVRGSKPIPKIHSSISAISSSSNENSVKKSNWRKKHEEFIAAIRAAKEVQAHLARGGKLSDLPPPPPSENPDYISCPHCSRRFNEAAANRHIPKCANMMHNKPKPAPRRR